jgi:hypothetical protein
LIILKRKKACIGETSHSDAKLAFYFVEKIGKMARFLIGLFDNRFALYFLARGGRCCQLSYRFILAFGN